jgi:hypothetical protein
MRIIPTKVHGLMDYLYGIALIMLPFFFAGEMFGNEDMLPIMVGAGVIIMSLCTDYEWGAFKILPMKSHLTIDMITGIFLAVSPWLFGFADEVFWPYLIFGAIAIITPLLSQTKPSRHGKLGPSTI